MVKSLRNHKDKRYRIKGAVKCFIRALFLVTFAFALIWVNDMKPSYANWHDIDMNPGETYDCSKADKNTSVNISKPGDYYLKGKSNYVRVHVKSGGVNLYLEDGLNLNCGIYSYIGSRTAPINIGEQGGTVKIISRKNAKIYLEGYMAPGIRKDGNTTALVFETEDPDNPGSIEVKGGNYGAGIGSVAHVGSEMYPPCGNITINSGYIKATGTNDSAGIGGGPMTRVDGIYINGGEVHAEGSKQGAGIGAGYYAGARNIYINGGKVFAQTQNYYYQTAAAIGGGGGAEGGYSAMTGENIRISGGEVQAISYGGGCAIGGGGKSNGENIVISGGKVHAEIKRASNGKRPGSVPAIGGGGGNNVADGSVRITGGIVYAKGGDGAPGIGSKGNYLDHAKIRVQISGGTVTAEHGPSDGHTTDYDIGGHDKDNVEVTITGGSVYASKIQNAKDDKGQPLHRVDVLFDGISQDNIRVSDAVFSDSSFAYGMNDVYTAQGGKIYPWLQTNNSSVMLTNARLGEWEYGGRIKCSAESGILYPATNLTLMISPEGAGSKNGIGYAAIGNDRITITEDPVPAKGYKLVHYAVNADNKIVLADKDGKLRPSVAALTDADGKWIGTKSSSKILAYCVGVPYKIHFDSNEPKGASTSVSGTMADQDYTYGTEQALSSNYYQLPGYVFKGWALKSQPTADDKIYTNGDSDKTLCTLTTEENKVVTLYAQWTPMTYQITYSDGLGAGGTSQCTEYKQEVAFDSYARLARYSDDTFGWTGRSNPGETLNGWTGAGFGSFYSDGCQIYNYIEKDENGNPRFDQHGNLIGKKMTAQWINGGVIAVTINKDGEPQSGLSDYLFLISETGEVFRPQFVYANGSYVYDPSTGALAPGNYKLCFDTQVPPAGGAAGPAEYVEDSIEITYDGAYAVSTVFDYYTVSIIKDPSQEDLISSVTLADNAGVVQPSADGKLFVPEGRKVNIQTAVKAGYHFDGYSVYGIKPGSSDDSSEYDPSVSNQTISVRGTAELMAHAEANVYTVHFNKNYDSIVSGEMEDQDMVYDQKQQLFANKYDCIGGSFAGWNTKKDGSGDSFSDGSEALNLTTEDGGTVTLYAQWDLENYDIEYDLDGGKWPDSYSPIETYTSNSPTFSITAPEWPDDTKYFAGWVGTDITMPVNDVTIKQGSTGDREYTACWKDKTYLVTFELNGGVGETEELVLIHHKLTKPEDPVREHYTFAGWYTDEALTKAYDFDTEITEDKVLYAKWNHITHQITYDLNGGTLDGQTGKIVIDANEGDVITVMKAPTRDGYTFKYWKGSEYYPGDSYTVTEDHTLTAEWEKAENGNNNENGNGNGNGNNNGNGSNNSNGSNRNSNNNKAVNTGDSVDIGLLYMIMLCSAVCIVLLLRKKKR